MKIIFAALLCALVTRAYAQSPPTPVGAVKEGVYFLNGMFQTTIVELKDGQFRFWFSSDAKIGGDETKYPLSGRYATNSGQITIVTTNSYTWPDFNGQTKTMHHLPRTNVWTFINYQGQTTLWRPEALKYWEEAKKVDGYGVLFPTDHKPEEILEHKGIQPAKKSNP